MANGKKFVNEYCMNNYGFTCTSFVEGSSLKCKAVLEGQEGGEEDEKGRSLRKKVSSLNCFLFQALIVSFFKPCF